MQLVLAREGQTEQKQKTYYHVPSTALLRAAPGFRNSALLRSK